MKYDIIGDIHGCFVTLSALLKKLEYKHSDGIWCHADRKAIFLGDFIDRGPFQEEVISLVRPMIESGSALAVMGNHEFNAISFFTESSTGKYLREHSAKNIHQHKEFLDVYESNYSKWKDVIDWFKTLPLWLDLEGIRVVHACWDLSFIDKISELQAGSNKLSESLLRSAADQETWQFQAIETLLKGKEISLPEGKSFQDKDGNTRHNIRVQWWNADADTYKRAFLGPEIAVTHIPDDPIHGDHLIEYAEGMKPVFLGHYWLDGNPEPLTSNIACVDYSVAKENGKLVAYRWSGESKLISDNFLYVERLEP